MTIVVVVVSAPLRRRKGSLGRASGLEPTVWRGVAAGGEALQAAREAKYREIRDSELDYRTGKLSREDFEAIDRELRAEAVEILNRIEAGEA